MKCPPTILAVFLSIPTLLFPACGGAKTSPETDLPMESRLVLTGVLTPTVESGGWLLKTEDAEYLLLDITAYRKADWFQAGRRVQVAGREAPEVSSIYMQGTPLQVIDMQPVGDLPGVEKQ